MVLGVLTLHIHLPESSSLKKKRMIIRSVKDRIRGRFNVSFSEVDYQDKWQRSTLGAAIVTNDVKYANSVLSKIVDQMNSEKSIVLLDYAVDIN